MKFGKTLNKVKDGCNPEWGPYWLSYKLLKSMIKVLPCYTSKIDGGESLDLRRACSRRMRLILSKDKLETEFFSLLKKELAKTEDFYQAEIRCLILRYNRLQYTLKILSKDEDSQTDFRLALSACVQLYKESVELQTYAVTQYCGFGKILKKHDKNTEYVTCASFMQNVVNRCDFVNFSRLVNLLVRLKSTFEFLQDKSSALLDEEDKFFIEALLDLQHTSADCKKDEDEEEKRERSDTLLHFFEVCDTLASISPSESKNRSR